MVGKCYKRHRATEFLDFLKELDRNLPEGPDVLLVIDNYATHKTPKVKAWLARRPNWHVHFKPTSASWLNQIEPWFAELTRKQANPARCASLGRRVGSGYYGVHRGA